MTMDLRAAEACSNQLKACCNEAQQLYNAIRSTRNKLLDADGEAWDELHRDLNESLTQLEHSIVGLKNLTRGLDGVRDTVRRTEERVLAKVDECPSLTEEYGWDRVLPSWDRDLPQWSWVRELFD